MITPFRINTCKSVSKQRTLTFFRINTYEKPGEGVPACQKAFPRQPRTSHFLAICSRVSLECGSLLPLSQLKKPDQTIRRTHVTARPPADPHAMRCAGT